MKLSIFFAIFAVVFAFANSAEDGKYRSTEAVTTLRPVPTVPSRATIPTIRPVPSCQWPYDRCDQPAMSYPDYDHRYNHPRYDPRDTRDPRFNPYPAYSPRYDPRYDPRDAYHPTRGVVTPKIGTRGYFDRPIRLEEKIDAKGYHFIYETARGIYAEEVGTFEGIIALNRPTGIKIQGFVQIKDGGVETFRMDYQASSKDPEIARRSPIREQERMPPTLARAVELMESHA